VFTKSLKLTPSSVLIIFDKCPWLNSKASAVFSNESEASKKRFSISKYCFKRSIIICFVFPFVI